MEVWSFINKNTKKLIKFSRVSTNDDFGCKYFFTNSELEHIWLTEFYEDIEFLINNNFIHPEYSIIYRNPSKEIINFNDYEPIKIDLSYELR